MKQDIKLNQQWLEKLRFALDITALNALRVWDAVYICVRVSPFPSYTPLSQTETFLFSAELDELITLNVIKW